MPKPSIHQISDLEYEALPPALQRKYFSSLERLRLAHDGSSSSPISKPHMRRRSTFATRTRSLLESFDTLPTRPSFKPSTSYRRGSQSTKTRRPDTPVNPDTAAWFASLPPTIRRKHFTKEEQILFANERQTVILDAADELLQRQTAPSETSSPGLARPHTSYSDALTDQYFSAADPDSEDELEHEDVDQEGDAVDIMNEQQLQDSLGWLDEAELDLHLDDYHAAITETSQRQAATLHRQSFRKNLSLSTMSLRRSSISSPTKSMSRGQTHSVYFRTSEMPSTPRRPSAQHNSRTSISSIDPRATHYQDPAARMKLRVYLASPSKFDEAVEFGFPSMLDKRNKTGSDRPKTSPRLTHESGRSFHTDETPSLDADDASSQGDGEVQSDPRTPDDSEFRDFVKSQKNSIDRLSVKPQLVRPEQYAHSTTLDREMTIHMTLTRPDLRSPSDTRPTSRHINAQPLEQPALPPLENQASFWDSLPSPQESKVKKFWRKMRRV